MKRSFLLLFMFFILCGCGTKSEINLENLLNEKEYVIIDVRTNEEYEELHVVDAINIPYDEINDEIDIDKGKNLFVYCKSGKRSKIAYETLDKLGYNVYDLGAIDNIDLPKE